MKSGMQCMHRTNNFCIEFCSSGAAEEAFGTFGIIWVVIDLTTRRLQLSLEHDEAYSIQEFFLKSCKSVKRTGASSTALRSTHPMASELAEPADEWVLKIGLWIHTCPCMSVLTEFVDSLQTLLG